jgi:colanic acid/amylovoran biosynthesis glycosyltransferase
MRVLYLTNERAKEYFIEPEVSYLNRSGVQIDVFSLRDRSRWPANLGSVGAAVPMLLQVAVWMAREPRLGPRSAAKNLLGAWVGTALAKQRSKAEYDILLAFWATVPATVAMLLSSAWRIPFGFTAHRGDIYARQLLAAKTAKASFVRAISHRGADLLARMAPISERKTVVIPLGVDIPAWRPSPEVAGPGRVLAVGRLLLVKGHNLLLSAVEDILAAGDSLDLDIVGGGPEFSRLRKRVVTSPALRSHVRLLGELPHGQVLQMMTEGYSCLVHSSITDDRGLEEGIPVVLLEAGARGLPFVATTSGATGELVNAETGWPCAPNSAEALASAVRSAVHSPAEAGRRAKAARHLIEEKWDADHTGRQLLELLRASSVGAKAPRRYGL